MASRKWRPNIWYRKRNITSFIFPSKNFKASGDSLSSLNCVPGLIYQLKLLVFDSFLRDAHGNVIWSLKIVKNLCPNFQKSSPLSKMATYLIYRKKKIMLFLSWILFRASIMQKRFIILSFRIWKLTFVNCQVMKTNLR